MALTQIIPLDRYNWELCLDIKLTEMQEHFIPSVLHSLAQANFENLTPMGILYRDKMVGFIMYGEFGGICWLNRIIIDREYQRMGIGSSAVRQLLTLLKRKVTCREIRTSYAAENEAANDFFQSLGFVPGENITGEIIATIS